MQKKIKFKGLWHLPGSDDMVNGYLTYFPDSGTQLELLAVLGEENDRQYEHMIIRGITSDGKKITPYKCFSLSRSFAAPGFRLSTYDVIFLFLGKHFLSTDELSFNNIVCRYRDFDNWLDIYGFTKIKYQEDTKEAIHEYSQPEDLLFTISDDLKCTFKFQTYMKGSTHASVAKIKQVCEVVLSPEKASSKFEDLFSRYLTFSGFLSLAYFANPLVEKVNLNIEAVSGKGEKYFKKIEVYYQQDLLKKGYEKKNHRNYFLFGYKEVEQNFENILQRWFRAKDYVSPTIDGLTETFIKREQAIEFKFLNVAHAIELYHRRTKVNQSEPKEIHKKKIIRIVEAVGVEDGEWLKMKLEFSNEPTLSERLHELINEIPEKVKAALFKDGASDFITTFKNTRNYYTHYSKNLEKKVLKSSALATLTERSKILLVAIV